MILLRMWKLMLSRLMDDIEGLDDIIEELDDDIKDVDDERIPN